jgi:dTMP kinase
MQIGKLVVIEGTDGSGKGTQLAMLLDYCTAHHIPHASLDFPQYYKTFFGRWVGRFMKGEFGGAKDVPPYIASIPYAADRWQAKDELEQWLSDGKTVFINRYVGSNAAYQSSKLPKSERQAYVNWQFEMEYEVFGIPREDIVIFLYVPFAVSQQLLPMKAARKYMGNTQKKDIHESNIPLLLEVEKVYLEFCARFPHWVKIDCTKNNTILPKEEIHKKILSVLRRKRIIP